MACFHFHIYHIEVLGVVIIMGHCIILAFIYLEVQNVLQKIAKKKGNDCLLEWIKPCANHLYWCATTTINGAGQVIWAKFE